MKNHKLNRTDFKIRELPPKVKNTPEGVQVSCPFCTPPHPILPGVESACGTTLKVTAVQTILTAHASKFNKVICVKCGESGGEMVKYMNSYVHLVDCKPDTKLLAEMPAMNKWAKVVIKLPEWLRRPVEKRTGHAQEVREIDAEGKETGRVLGHFFYPKGV